MKCSNCKKENPEDSAFCQYCGHEITPGETVAQCPSCGHELPEDSEFCQYCGHRLNGKETETVLEGTGVITGAVTQCQHISADNKKEPSTKCEKKQGIGKTGVILLIIAAVLIVALAGLNVYQYTVNSSTVSELNSQISEKEATISKKNSEVLKYKSKAGYYDKITSELESGHTGYANSYFNVSQGVISLEKGGAQTVTLNSDFGTPATISYHSSSSKIADVTFDENSWHGGSTTITFHGYSTGVATINFSNNVDSGSFKVVVIVKP